MQGINTRKHKDLVKVISQYAELSEMAGHIIPDIHKHMISENISAFKGTHDYYTILMRELQNCLDSYVEIQHPLQKALAYYVRRMKKEVKSEK